MDDFDVTAKHWGTFQTRPRHKLSWLESEAILRKVNQRISGSYDTNMYQWFQKLYPQKFSKALIVGCGNGQLDRDLYKMGFFEQGLGIDIAKESIAHASSMAKQEGLLGLSYEKFNLEIDDYKILGKFDLIIINMVAHHINNLDGFFFNISQISKSNNSIQVLSEYVGPNRFQTNNTVNMVINSLLNSLDNSLKKDYSNNLLSIKKSYVPPVVSEIITVDPSEAINSENILKYYEKYFNIIEKKNYGGTINHMLLNGIISNFEEIPMGNQILDLLMTFEEILEKLLIIESDFVFMISKLK